MNALVTGEFVLKISNKANFVTPKSQSPLTKGKWVTVKLPNPSTKHQRPIYATTAKSGSGQTEVPLKSDRSSLTIASDDRISRISSAIRVIPDFPIPGILFQDITMLLLDPKAFGDTIDLFVERYKGKDISVVAGKHNKPF